MPESFPLPPLASLLLTLSGLAGAAAWHRRTLVERLGPPTVAFSSRLPQCFRGRTAACRYTVAGAAFGFCFPVVGTLLASQLQAGSLALSHLWETQRDSPLLWIIDTAPFWLGLFARFAGQRQDRLQALNTELHGELRRRRASEERLVHARRQAEAAQTDAEALQQKAECAQQEANLAKERALEASRVKSAILDTVSHELRTPLSSIIGFAEVLVEEADAEQKEFAGHILKSGQRLNRTVRAVLDVANERTQGPPLQYETVDLRALAMAGLEPIRSWAHEQNLALHVEEGPAVVAHTDRACVSRILRQLLENAVTYTESGSVTVRLRSEASTIALEVEDTGVGITPDFLPHLFESFRRESEGLRRPQQGSGMGLTIAQRLADRIGATIEAESTKGVGSTFTLRLPRTPATHPLPAPEEQVQ